MRDDQDSEAIDSELVQSRSNFERESQRLLDHVEVARFWNKTTLDSWNRFQV